MGGEEGWAPLCVIERWRAETVCVCLCMCVWRDVLCERTAGDENKIGQRVILGR